MPVDVKFQRADGVCNMLYGVTLTVGEVIHGIDAPLVPGTVMMGKFNAVKERVTEHHVGMRHVNFGTEHLLSLCVLPRLHLTEELEVFLYAAVPPWAGGTGLVHGAAVCADFLLGLVIYICQAAFDEFFRPFIKLVKVIRRIEFLVPVEAQPLNILLDGIHVLSVFLCGVGVIIAEVGFATVLLGQAEVEADALGMAEVKISVGLRRKTGDDGIYFSLCEILFNNLFDKVKFTLFHNYRLTPKVTKKTAHICFKKFFSNFVRLIVTKTLLKNGTPTRQTGKI